MLAFAWAQSCWRQMLVSERLLMNIGPAGADPGLADFTPALNHGVSFSLFTQNTDTGTLSADGGAVRHCRSVCWCWPGRRKAGWRLGLRPGPGRGAGKSGGSRPLWRRRVRFSGAASGRHAAAFVCNLSDIAISAAWSCWRRTLSCLSRDRLETGFGGDARPCSDRPSARSWRYRCRRRLAGWRNSPPGSPAWPDSPESFPAPWPPARLR